MAEYGYLRQDENVSWYLIPESEIEEYDELQAAIEDAEWLSNEWYALTAKYNEKYREYRLEGEMFSLKVLIE